MKKIKLFIISLVSLLSLSAIITPVYILAEQDDTTTTDILINCGVSGELSDTCTDAVTGGSDVTTTVQRAIRLFQVVVGLVAVFMIIFGGLKYITSGGNDNGIKSAKNTLLYAVVGLVIVLIAEGVVRFVLTRFSS